MGLDRGVFSRQAFEFWESQIVRLPPKSLIRQTMNEMLEAIHLLEHKRMAALEICNAYANQDVDKKIFLEMITGNYPAFYGERYGWAKLNSASARVQHVIEFIHENNLQEEVPYDHILRILKGEGHDAPKFIKPESSL